MINQANIQDRVEEILKNIRVDILYGEFEQSSVTYNGNEIKVNLRGFGRISSKIDINVDRWEREINLQYSVIEDKYETTEELNVATNEEIKHWFEKIVKLIEEED